ncbi:MAG: hypothetical protein FWD27_08715 [Coriobacteriia bacterium]|nr:hypothetical protein [Coriobacteriia bacterium]
MKHNKNSPRVWIMLPCQKISTLCQKKQVMNEFLYKKAQISLLLSGIALFLMKNRSLPVYFGRMYCFLARGLKREIRVKIKYMSPEEATKENS